MKKLKFIIKLLLFLLSSDFTKIGNFIAECSPPDLMNGSEGADEIPKAGEKADGPESKPESKKYPKKDSGTESSLLLSIDKLEASLQANSIKPEIVVNLEDLEP